MARIVPYVVGGIVAIAAMELAPMASQYLGVSPSSAEALSARSSAPANVGIGKSDRAAAPMAMLSALEVATVEVIGLGQPAIVYRHRDGRELFRTDPVDNVTVVTKGFVLPQITVRRDAQSEVTPVRMLDVDAQRAPEPVRSRPAPVNVKEPASGPQPMPTGCESSFSPVASPNLAHHLGRCMADNGVGPVLAFNAG